jgi:ATP-binding cassette subfamily C protein CydD
MTPAEASAGRDLLKSWGRAENAPVIGQSALILINAAGAATFAAALAAIVTRTRLPAAILALPLALVLRALAAWCSSLLAARHARRVVTRLRGELAAAALEHRRGEGPPLGVVLSAVVDEPEALDGYFNRYRPAELEARLAPLAIAALAALASPVSAGILIATLLPFGLVMAVAGGAAAAESSRQLDALARLSGRFLDRVRALPVILAFQAEARETQGVALAAQEVSRRTLGVLRIAFISTASLELFAAVSIALVAVYCGFSLLGLLPFKAPETLDLRRAFFALALAPEFYAPMRRLAAAYHEKQLGEAAAARLSTALLRPHAWEAPSLPARTSPPEVAVRDLSLRFGDVSIGPVSFTARDGGRRPDRRGQVLPSRGAARAGADRVRDVRD